jgi:hypothetical protein
MCFTIAPIKYSKKYLLIVKKYGSAIVVFVLAVSSAIRHLIWSDSDDSCHLALLLLSLFLSFEDRGSDFCLSEFQSSSRIPW